MDGGVMDGIERIGCKIGGRKQSLGSAFEREPYGWVCLPGEGTRELAMRMASLADRSS